MKAGRQRDSRDSVNTERCRCFSSRACFQRDFYLIDSFLNKYIVGMPVMKEGREGSAGGGGGGGGWTSAGRTKNCPPADHQ